MKRTTYTALTAILSIVLSSTPTRAQVDLYGRWVNGISEPSEFDYRTYSEQEAVVLQERWKLVEAENLTAKSNEWSGDYIMGDVGDVSMVILRWAPDSGFAYLSVYNCLPTIRALNYGKVEFSPNLLQLLPEVSKKHTNNNGHGGHARAKFDEAYLPVRWGECHYLIAKNRLSVFYDCVAGFGLYRPGAYGFLADEGFLLKKEDRDKPVYGMPVVPPGYESFVKRPMNGTIISIGREYLKRMNDSENPWWNELITEVTLNIGQTQGVRRRMTFIILDSKRGELVEVTRVARDSSQGRIVRPVRKRPEENDGKDPEYPAISVGWRLSTSPHQP